MFAIIQDVLFPLMSHSDADEELWFTDPHEYIRIKFGKITSSLKGLNKILLCYIN